MQSVKSYLLGFHKLICIIHLLSLYVCVFIIGGLSFGLAQLYMMSDVSKPSCHCHNLQPCILVQ